MIMERKGKRESLDVRGTDGCKRWREAHGPG